MPTGLFKLARSRPLFAAIAVVMLALAAPASAVADDDDRILVTLPPDLHHKMLENMRKHLESLDDILSKLAWGNIDEAGRIAEEELGMSSLDEHESAKIGPLLPPEMSQLGKDMHRAASRLVIAYQNAEFLEPEQGMKKFADSLQEVTSYCTACHLTYRLR